MTNVTNIKGYKVFNPDWTCRGFQFEPGKIFEEDVTPVECESGFHFCKQAIDCFKYYNFDPNNKVAEVVALGEISEGENKCATNKLHIVRELTWQEVLELVNFGKGNTGLGNTGDGNTGNRNTGDRNTGNRNTGDWNTGDGNQGDHNAGDFNISDYNTGCFNIEQHTIKIFDTNTDMTLEQWRRSDAYKLLRRIDFMPTTWVWASDMTDKEKEQYPSYKTTDGYLRTNDLTQAYQKWWDKLDDEEKEEITSIPNFDGDKFKLITGININ